MEAKPHVHGLRALGVVLVFSMSLAMCLALLTGSARATERWTDISDAQWTAGYGVTADEAATVATGYDDGTFRPSLSVGRGHFAKMAVTGLGLDTSEPATPTFSDVGATAALYPWIEGAAAAGLISGYDDGAFRSAAPVTRRQACSILALFLSNRELSVAGHIAGDHGDYPSLEAWFTAEGAGVLAAFSDAGSVSPVHAPAVAYLVHRDVVQGSSRSGGVYLDPLNELTRAQAVVLILRVAGLDSAPAASLEAFVSTAWLEANLGRQGLVVLDLRSAADYAAGHIPGAISVPFSSDSAWAEPADGLGLQLPSQQELFTTIGACGIAAGSPVVLVGGIAQTEPTYPLVDTARVATTLIYAGVKEVAILQGGHGAWAGEGRAVTIDVPAVLPVAYEGTVDGDIFVSTEYVKARIGTATIVDTRSAATYSGATIDAAAPKPGHIPTAKSLPVQSAWQTGGTYAPVDVLRQLATGVLGEDRDQQIIVYCTYGGTASCWWFVLSQVLGYTDVRLYDGSAQAWVKDNDMVTDAGGS